MQFADYFKALPMPEHCRGGVVDYRLSGHTYEGNAYQFRSFSDIQTYGFKVIAYNVRAIDELDYSVRAKYYDDDDDDDDDEDI